MNINSLTFTESSHWARALLLSVTGALLTYTSATQANDLNRQINQEKMDMRYYDNCESFSILCVPYKPRPPVKPLPPGDYVIDEVVMATPARNAAKTKALIKKFKLTEAKGFQLGALGQKVVVAKTNGQHPAKLSNSINAVSKTVRATPNYIYRVSSSEYEGTFDYKKAGLESMHLGSSRRGEGIRIGMIDTMVDENHSAFKHANIHNHNLVHEASEKVFDKVHGTSIAGILVSQDSNIGLAPDAELHAVNVFSAPKHHPHSITATSADIAQGVDLLMRKKVDIINMSFVGSDNEMVRNVVDKAMQRGIIVVAAGGNSGRVGSSIVPASLDGVLAITAVDDNRQRYPRASRGVYIDLAAPGVNILTTAPNNKYQLITGTSQATAHVSGVIARMLSTKRDGFSIDTMLSTAIDLGKPGRDIEYGEGLVNLDGMLRSRSKGK